MRVNHSCVVEASSCIELLATTLLSAVVRICKRISCKYRDFIRYRAAFNSILLHSTISYGQFPADYPFSIDPMPFRERVLLSTWFKWPLCTAGARTVPAMFGRWHPCVSLPVREWQLPSADYRLYTQKKINIHPLYIPFFKHELGLHRVPFSWSKLVRILRIEEVPNSKVNIWLASSLVEWPADTCLSRDALSEQRTLVKLLNSIHIIFLFFYFLPKIPRQQNTTTDI